MFHQHQCSGSQVLISPLIRTYSNSWFYTNITSQCHYYIIMWNVLPEQLTGNLTWVWYRTDICAYWVLSPPRKNCCWISLQRKRRMLVIFWKCITNEHLIPRQLQIMWNVDLRLPWPWVLSALLSWHLINRGLTFKAGWLYIYTTSDWCSCMCISRYLGKVFFICYVMLVFFILVSMVVSIICCAYNEVITWQLFSISSLLE